MMVQTWSQKLVRCSSYKFQYLVFFLVVVQMPRCIFGTITVHHKLTRGIVYTVEHEFLPFNYVSNSASSKGHLLVVSDPIDACTSINPPPIPDLHSVRKNAILQPSWILLADDTDCDVHYKIVQAQRQGYSGVIIYSNDSVKPQPMTIQSHLTHLYEVNISFIGLEDGLELKKYAYSKPYVLKIERDWSLVGAIEDIYNYCTTSLTWLLSFLYIPTITKGRIRNYMETFVQILILTSPIWFLIGYSWKNYELGNLFKNHQYQKYEDNSTDKEHNQNEFCTPKLSKYDEYRRLLGISHDATKAQVESAFRRKSAIYHPDKNLHLLKSGRKEELEAKTEIFRKMNNAKDKLIELF